MNIQEARQDYLDYLAEKNKSHATSATYAYAIGRFLGFLAGEPHLIPSTQDIAAVTADHLRLFSRYIYHQNLAPVTRRTYLVVLRNWFKYLARLGVTALNPDLIELPKIPTKVPYPDERLPVMLSTSLPTKYPWQKLLQKRDKALLETLFSTQLRVSELIALNRNSIDWQQGLAVVTGKGGKSRPVFFSEPALAALNEYLDARNDDFIPIFIHHDRAHKPERRDKDGVKMRLTRQAVEAVVRKYAKLAGVEATPHSFRHYGATELLRAGADIRTVQEILGHSSVSTTQIYTHVSPRRLEQDWRRFHPAAKVKAKEKEE